ncbi:MAG: cation:proton antiporter [Faecalibacterium sp.]
MEQILICLSVALIAGLLASRAAKSIRLPAVTSYLIAGLLLGPFFLGRLGIPGIGFATLEAVDSYKIITQVALGFIAFVIGNEFRLGALKSMGRQAITVGIFQAVITTLMVDAALIVLHLLRPDILSVSSAITLGAIASATAPAATLMVVKQYKANGPLTRLLLMVVAIDDAVGLVLFSVSFGIANALEQGRIDPVSVIVEPIVEIFLSLGLGALAGFVLNLLEIYFHSRSKRMSLSVAFVLLTVGLSMVEFHVGPVRCGFSLLLVCMMTGTVFCNICPTSEELMDRVDRWTSPINILFFVLSGAELDLQILTNPLVLLIGVVYIISRSSGKISGSYLSCRLTHCSSSIQKHLGITLLPQAGVALGMALTAASLSDGAVVRNVVLFSVLVYELVGPTLTKMSLTAAGEIAPEGRTSARTENKPKEPISLR